MGSCIREDDGEGKGGSRAAPTWESSECDVGGQPQGLPLRRGHVGRDVDREEEGRFAYPSLRLVDSSVIWRSRAGSRRACFEGVPERVCPTGNHRALARQAMTMGSCKCCDIRREQICCFRLTAGMWESPNELNDLVATSDNGLLKPAPMEKELSVGGVGKMGSRPRLHGGRPSDGNSGGRDGFLHVARTTGVAGHDVDGQPQELPLREVGRRWRTT